MTATPLPSDGPSLDRFNVMVVGQAGRLGYEAALFVASLRAADPDFRGRVIVAEPQAGPLWDRDPSIADADLRALLTGDLGAEIVPFETCHFGSDYPYGNKIEGLATLPPDAPFVFFDSDTLITGPLSRVPFDFAKPGASLQVTGTWPKIDLYGPDHDAIWGALYRRFGLDFDSSLDLSHPGGFWRRYLYFNAGWFYHADPATFAGRFLEIALSIRDDPPPELICQALDPWLDQVALPLVIHGLGGGRSSLPSGYLDGSVSCHYRLFPLLYARESDRVVTHLEEILGRNRIKKVLKAHLPLRRMALQGKGRRVRAMFDQAALPPREETIRNRIKKAGLWMR